MRKLEKFSPLSKLQISSVEESDQGRSSELTPLSEIMYARVEADKSRDTAKNVVSPGPNGLKGYRAGGAHVFVSDHEGALFARDGVKQRCLTLAAA